MHHYWDENNRYEIYPIITYLNYWYIHLVYLFVFTEINLYSQRMLRC